MQRVRIGTAIGESFGFLGAAWRQAWGILLLWVWLTGATQAIVGLRPEWFFVSFLAFPFSIAVSTATIGALYRIGVEYAHPGDPRFRAHPAGLWWGALEWRVLGANLLLGLILGGIAVAMVFMWTMVLGVAGVAMGLQGQTNSGAGAVITLVLISTLIWIPGLVGLLYLGARWLIYPLLAADTGSFNLGQAWTMTRGSVFAVIVALIVIFLAQIGMTLLSYLVFGGIASVASKDPTAFVVWGGIASQIIVTAFAAPLGIGLQLSVYRATRPDGGYDVAATFS
jgi:hypothetical protein